MKEPFFSIIVPVKGREFFLRDTLKSVILQDFKDFELIVSDNFNDKKVRLVVDEFVSDPRVKYLRTDRELCMLDHFEFASKKVAGRYVLFVGNRSLILNGSLRKLYEAIQNYPAVPLWTWQHLIYDDDTGFVRAAARASYKVEIVPTSQLLKDYRNVQAADYRFPVVLHAAYRKDIAETIRRKHRLLFAPLVPEGTPLFLMLHYADNVGIVHEPLFLEHGEKYSTGFLTDTQGNEKYLRTLSLKQGEWFQYVPIKKAPFNHNLFVEDYLAVKILLEGKHDFNDDNWVTYFVRCYDDYAFFDFIKKRKKEFLGAFEEALTTFSKDIQRKVRRKMLKRRLYLGVKAFIRKSPFIGFLRRIQNRLQYGAENKRYKTVLEAAGFSPNAK